MAPNSTRSNARTSPSSKRQSTLDESNIDVPETKKRKVEPEVPEEVKREVTRDTTEPVKIDRDRKGTEKDSSALQKGLIYFFYRPRVDHEKITSTVDAQRSYIILRPFPQGTKLEDGTDVNEECHFIELPKKQLPQKGDQFMSFVAKGKALKEDLVARLGSSTYSTKTRGERTTPAARPAGEGVYTIASIASTTHLAYILTQPDEPGEVQKAFGIHAQGSFVVSTKNPESNAQGNQLPGNAKFSSILQNEFGSRSWLPMKPQHLTYDDCGLLLIGEKDEKVEEVDQDHVLSDLHTEDVSRESLHQIFEDLGLSLKTHQSKPLLGEFA